MKRWFAVPVVGSGAGADLYRPKYADRDGVDGWAGQQVSYNGLDYYVVRFTGSETALNGIEGESDAFTRQERGISKQQVAEWLNGQTGHNYTFQQWEERFIGGYEDV